MSIKTVRSFVSNYWQTALYALAGVSAVLFLLLYRLDSLLPAASAPEVATLRGGHTLSAIIDNPTFAPYKLIQLGLTTLGKDTLLYTRALSGAFALITLLILYHTLSKWYGTLIAAFGTFLMATSSWFLVFARMANPAITYTLLLAALSYGTWFKSTRKSGRLLLAGVLLAALLIYTPGLVWFVVLAVVWQKKSLLKNFVSSPKTAILGLLVLATLLSPLAYAMYKDHAIINQTFGFSGDPFGDIVNSGKHFYDTILMLFVSGQDNPAFGLRHLAVLDVFTSFMVLVGAYSYLFHRKLDRAKMVAVIVLLGTLLVSLMGSVSIVIMTPFIYLLAAGGINLMLERWHKVFPRNPLARTVGMCLMILAVSVTGIYHFERYFEAWPKTPDTIKAHKLEV